MQVVPQLPIGVTEKLDGFPQGTRDPPTKISGNFGGSHVNGSLGGIMDVSENNGFSPPKSSMD